MKRLILPIGALLCACASIPVGAQTLTTFTTSTSHYLYLGRGGFNADPGPVKIHETTTPESSGGGFPSTGTALLDSANINGVGLNQMDGYIYGILYPSSGPAASSTPFYRVGANGGVQQLGTLTPPTSANTGHSIFASLINTASGMVDGNGTYWFTAYTVENLTPPIDASKIDFFLGKVDAVAALPGSTTATINPTYMALDISDSRIQEGFDNFIGHAISTYITTGSLSNADGGAEDLALNPIDNQFYSYVQFPTSTSSTATLEHYPIKLNSAVTPWKVEPVGTLENTSPNTEIAGAYFTSSGGFYVLFTDGQYTPVSLSTGGLTNLQPSGLPLVSGTLRGDLASNLVAVPLEATFFSFTGRHEAGTRAALRWEMANGRGVQQYVVERSEDGQSFSAIATVQATSSQVYTHTDDGLPAGGAAYRIRAVREDGGSALSATVRMAGEAGGNTVNIFPTLITDGVLHLQATTNVRVRIVNALGVEVLAAAGAPELNLGYLPAGLYTVVAYDAATGAVLQTARVTKR